MTPEEKNDANKCSRLIRAGRKQQNLTQIELSSKLGISQSALSKLESAILAPSASNWFQFCQLIGIPSESSWKLGHIDRCTPAKISNEKRAGSFKIPTRYAHNQGTKVRILLPLLEYFGDKVGEKKLSSYFETIGMDEDYFAILDNQVNLNLSLDIVTTLTEKGVLKKDDLPALASAYSRPKVHGALAEEYDRSTKFKTLVSSFFRNVKKYEINFAYDQTETTEDSVRLIVSPNEHMEAFNYKNDTLGNFVCSYKKQALKAFFAYGNQSIEVSEKECHFTGKSHQCVYDVKAV